MAIGVMEPTESGRATADALPAALPAGLPFVGQGGGELLIALLAAAVATLVSARLVLRFPRCGLLDGPVRAGGRKLQAHAVPAVGGIALAVALLVSGVLLGVGGVLIPTAGARVLTLLG